LESLREPKVAIELLPFHQMAHAKYESLGAVYEAGQLPTISIETMAELSACMA
jgi:pyruvate-formate lyase-activating enzyme